MSSDMTCTPIAQSERQVAIRRLKLVIRDSIMTGNGKVSEHGKHKKRNIIQNSLNWCAPQSLRILNWSGMLETPEVLRTISHNRSVEVLQHLECHVRRARSRPDVMREVADTIPSLRSFQVNMLMTREHDTLRDHPSGIWSQLP